MKILFVVSEYSFLYLFETCKILKKNKLKPFLCYLKNNNLSYNNQQIYKKNKKFKIPLFLRKEENFFSTKVDFKYLSYLDKKILKNKSLWEIISHDRDLGRSYIKEIIGYNSDYLNKKENILSNIINTAKNIERIIKKTKPDVLCWPTCISNIEAYLFYAFCTFYKVKFITAITTRFQNYFYFASDLYYNNTKIKKNYFLTNKLKINNQNIEKLYQKIKKTNSLSSDTEKVKENILVIKRNIFLTISMFVNFLIKHTIFFFMFKLGYKKKSFVNLNKYVFFQPVYEQIKKINSILYLKKNKYSNITNTKYIYFPLHKLPEYSLQLKGNIYMDQSYVIECLSKNIPIGYKLYVKEHPSNITSHARPKSFYDNILKIPNVELVSYDISGRDLVKNAKLVVVIDGSSAVEAIIEGTPVLTLTSFVYDFLGLAVENSNIKELNNDIKKAISLKNKYSSKERKNKIKRLLNSIIVNCYNMRNVDIFYYTNLNYEKNIINNDGREIKEVAEDYSKAIIREINENIILSNQPFYKNYI